MSEPRRVVRFRPHGIGHSHVDEVLRKLIAETILEGEVVAVTSDSRAPSNHLGVRVRGGEDRAIILQEQSPKGVAVPGSAAGASPTGPLSPSPEDRKFV